MVTQRGSKPYLCDAVGQILQCSYPIGISQQIDRLRMVALEGNADKVEAVIPVLKVFWCVLEGDVSLEPLSQVFV